MELTPNDIRNSEFPTQLRGYDKDEVDEFLEQAATALEDAKQENLRLSIEIDSLKSQLSGVKQFEETIKSAAIDARRNADSLVKQAKEEATKFVEEARAEAAETINRNRAEVEALEERINQLNITKRSYVAKLKEVMNSHAELVDEIEKEVSEVSLPKPKLKDSQPVPTQAPTETLKVPEPPKPSPEDIEVEESAEVETKSRETVASKPKPSEDDSGKIEENEAPDDNDEPVEEKPETDFSDLSKLPDDSQDKPADPDATQPPGEADGMDPELAAALEQYKAKAQGQQEPQFQKSPADQVIETTARAEDIPPGFIAKDENGVPVEEDQTLPPSQGGGFDDDPEPEENTDREISTHPELAPEGEDQPTEHATLNIDEQDEDTVSLRKPASPDEVAQGLDEVARKFEEEIDRATKQ